MQFAPQNVIVIPARQTHVVGAASATAQTRAADEHCTLLADGLVKFTAGDGARDILLLCGAIPATNSSALGLFDLLREPMVESFAAVGRPHYAFELMLAEVDNPGLGTQAMTEVLMKQCLIVLLRQHLLQGGQNSRCSRRFTIRGLPALWWPSSKIPPRPTASRACPLGPE